MKSVFLQVFIVLLFTTYETETAEGSSKELDDLLNKLSELETELDSSNVLSKSLDSNDLDEADGKQKRELDTKNSNSVDSYDLEESDEEQNRELDALNDKEESDEEEKRELDALNDKEESDEEEKRELGKCLIAKLVVERKEK
ncbi:pre-mRNA-splicing factor cwf15-like [Protopterus annectens]|uniref:pre-mRNA-splicing factor cwf15-like n=1 Tax=Protopterus annectens TaxID=7888 RepID=UPI001CFA7609|nr:pre-mRNA-splicing factor cwf15-like [Protopterus annectens]